MIDRIDTLPGYEQKDVARFLRYMDLHGVDPATYRVGRPDGAPHDVIVSAAFSDARDDRANTVTSLRLPFAGEQPPLVTGLPKALDYIVHLLSEDGALDRLRRLDVTADDARLLAQLDIDAGQVCRASVKAWAPGSFLAPDDAGFTCFLVEDRGEIVRLAHSATLAPVAWAFAADADMERTDLHGRIGRSVSAAE